MSFTAFLGFLVIIALSDVSGLSAQSIKWSGWSAMHLKVTCISANPYSEPERQLFLGTRDGEILKGTRYKSFVPATRLAGGIMDFAFASNTLGWSAASSACVTTTNGGQDWSYLPVDEYLSQGGQWSCAYYQPFDSILYFTSTAGDLLRSSDLGVTWMHTTHSSLGGVVFLTPKHGVIGGNAGSPPLYTSDGGLTWDQSVDTVAAWRPWANLSTGRFYASCHLTNKVYHSLDSGRTWDSIFAPGKGVLSGQVVGNCDAMYVFGTHESYFSKDGGLTWDPIGGPGMGYPKTGFLVDSFLLAHNMDANQEKAFAHSALVKDSPTKLQIPVSPRMLTSCGVDIQSMFLTPITGCDSAVIMSTKLVASSAFEIQTSPIPWKLSDGKFRIRIRFEAIRSYDTAYLHLRILSGLKWFDTSIMIVGVLDPTTGSISGRETDMGSVSLCDSRSQWVKYRNTDCIDVQLRSISFAGGAGMTAIELPVPGKLMAPGAEDSVLVLLDPQVAGSCAGVLSLQILKYRTLKDFTLPITATVTSRLSVTSSTAAIDFDTIVTCSQRTRTFWIYNTSCERVQVQEFILPPQSRFSISPGVIGAWIDANDSLEIPVSYTTDKAREEIATLEVLLKTARNAMRVLPVDLKVVVASESEALQLSVASITASILPCATLDTTIIIRNPRACDTLDLREVVLSNSRISISPDKWPARLGPGESIEVTLHVEPNGEATIYDSIWVMGSLDTLIPLAFLVEGKAGGSLTLVNAKTAYSSMLCGTDKGQVTLRGSGCLGVGIKRVRVENADGHAHAFRLLTSVNSRRLMDDEELDIEIEFDPDLGGALTAHLIIECDDGSMQQIALRGELLSANESLQLKIEREDSKLLRIGEEFSVQIKLHDAVGSLDDLASLTTELSFDTDLLTLTEIEGMSGFDAWTQPLAGGIRILLEPSSSRSLSSGDPIASLRFKATLTDSRSTTMQLSRPILNEGDPEFARCRMTSAEPLGMVSAEVDPDCVERLFERAMRGLPIDGISVQQMRDHLEVRFEGMDGNSLINFVLLDQLGRAVHRSSHYRGSSVILPLPPSNGAFYLHVTGEGIDRSYPITMLK